uniref:Uncharacterized protein n=1 Tax=Amphimedon queenslandica TaxID=400682 RepID=A0A1X7SSS1_AMPQE
MTESELLEYQLFLKKLESSSLGHVVTVAPAPSDRRSSYLKHNRSKVGVENVTAMMTSTSSLNEESRPSSSSGSLTGASKKEPIRMVRVLPVNYPGKGRGAVIVKSGGDNNNDDSEKKMETEKEKNDDVAEHSNDISKVGDLIIEETDEWIPPTDEQGPLPPSLSPSVPITSHHKEDIVIEECDDEEDLSITDSGINGYQSEPQSSSRRNESQSSRNKSQSKRNGSWSKKNGSASKKKGSTFNRNGSETTRNGSEPNRNESQRERSDEFRKTVNLSSVSSELTLVDISEEKEEEEEENFKDSPQAMERDTSENIDNKELDEMERGEGEQEEENRVEGVPEMPLLRVKSTTSLYVPDYEYQSKRKRATPSYAAHCINSSTALGPPCPLYGVTQPTEAENVTEAVKVSSEEE